MFRQFTRIELNKSSGKLSEFVEDNSNYYAFVGTLRETCLSRTTSDFDIVFYCRALYILRSESILHS